MNRFTWNKFDTVKWFSILDYNTNCKGPFASSLCQAYQSTFFESAITEKVFNFVNCCWPWQTPASCYKMPFIVSINLILVGLCVIFVRHFVILLPFSKLIKVLKNVVIFPGKCVNSNGFQSGRLFPFPFLSSVARHHR